MRGFDWRKHRAERIAKLLSFYRGDHWRKAPNGTRTRPSAMARRRATADTMGAQGEG